MVRDHRSWPLGPQWQTGTIPDICPAPEGPDASRESPQKGNFWSTKFRNPGACQINLSSVLQTSPVKWGSQLKKDRSLSIF